MANRFFNNIIDLFSGSKAKASDIEAHFNLISAGFDDVQTEMDQKVSTVSPTFTGIPLAPTAAPGVSSQQIATTEFVAATALAASLPAQTGNAGKFLKTTGSIADWQALPSQNLVLLATLTPTISANIDFLSLFTASYDNYLIVANGVGCASVSNEVLRFQFAVAGTLDTASNYLNPVVGATTATTATSIDTGASSDSASAKTNLNMTVLNALAAVSKTLASAGTYGASAQHGAASKFGVYTGAAVSGFRLYWSAGGNFTATGKVRVYGYSNT